MQRQEQKRRFRLEEEYRAPAIIFEEGRIKGQTGEQYEAPAIIFEEGRIKGQTGEQYEAPAIIFEKEIEAVANTCNYDPPLTKDSVPSGCLGLTFS